MRMNRSCDVFLKEHAPGYISNLKIFKFFLDLRIITNENFVVSFLFEWYKSAATICRFDEHPISLFMLAHVFTLFEFHHPHYTHLDVYRLIKACLQNQTHIHSKGFHQDVQQGFNSLINHILKGDMLNGLHFQLDFHQRLKADICALFNGLSSIVIFDFCVSPWYEHYINEACYITLQACFKDALCTSYERTAGRNGRGRVLGSVIVSERLLCESFMKLPIYSNATEAVIIMNSWKSHIESYDNKPSLQKLENHNYLPYIYLIEPENIFLLTQIWLVGLQLHLDFHTVISFLKCKISTDTLLTTYNRMQHNCPSFSSSSSSSFCASTCLSSSSVFDIHFFIKLCCSWHAYIAGTPIYVYVNQNLTCFRFEHEEAPNISQCLQVLIDHHYRACVCFHESFSPFSNQNSLAIILSRWKFYSRLQVARKERCQRIVSSFAQKWLLMARTRLWLLQQNEKKQIEAKVAQNVIYTCLTQWLAYQKRFGKTKQNEYIQNAFQQWKFFVKVQKERRKHHIEVLIKERHELLLKTTIAKWYGNIYRNDYLRKMCVTKWRLFMHNKAIARRIEIAKEKKLAKKLTKEKKQLEKKYLFARKQFLSRRYGIRWFKFIIRKRLETASLFCKTAHIREKIVMRRVRKYFVHWCNRVTINREITAVHGSVWICKSKQYKMMQFQVERTLLSFLSYLINHVQKTINETFRKDDNYPTPCSKNCSHVECTCAYGTCLYLEAQLKEYCTVLVEISNPGMSLKEMFGLFKKIQGASLRNLFMTSVVYFVFQASFVQIFEECEASCKRMFNGLRFIMKTTPPKETELVISKMMESVSTPCLSFIDKWGKRFKLVNIYVLDLQQLTPTINSWIAEVCVRLVSRNIRKGSSAQMKNYNKRINNIISQPSLLSRIQQHCYDPLWRVKPL